MLGTKDTLTTILVSLGPDTHIILQRLGIFISIQKIDLLLKQFSIGKGIGTMEQLEQSLKKTEEKIMVDIHIIRPQAAKWLS